MISRIFSHHDVCSRHARPIFLFHDICITSIPAFWDAAARSQAHIPPPVNDWSVHYVMTNCRASNTNLPEQRYRHRGIRKVLVHGDAESKRHYWKLTFPVRETIGNKI